MPRSSRSIRWRRATSSSSTISVGGCAAVLLGAGLPFAGEYESLLAAAATAREWPTVGPEPRPEPVGTGTDPLTVDALYPRWEQFIRPDDIVVAETGTVSMGLGFARLPAGATFHNQTLWGSIGWATPAAFGQAPE